MMECVVKFAAHHPYYKDKLVGNPTRSFVCAANSLYFLCNLGNLSVAFLLTCNGGACVVEPGLVTKKGEPPRTSLYLIFCPFQPPSLLSSTLSKCTAISKWQHNLALASFPLLADNSSVKLTNEALLGLSCITQTVKSSPNDHALLNKQLQ